MLVYRSFHRIWDRLRNSRHVVKGTYELFKSSQSAHCSQWAYRIPFACQLGWCVFLGLVLLLLTSCRPIPVAILIYLAPESPWWLVRRGRLSDAEHVVVRLGVAEGISPSDRVAEMVRTIEIERASTEGASYIDCFRGTDLRRTL